MTKQDLNKYKKLGWEFYLTEGWFNEREWGIQFKSPRMDDFRALNWSKLGGTFEEFWERAMEKELLEAEATAYAARFFNDNKYSLEYKVRDAILAGDKEFLIKL